MSASGSSSDGSSLAGFGAELEAELLGDGAVDGGGAAYEAHARELSGAAGAADDDAEPGAKRARVDDAPAAAAAAPTGPGGICPPHPGFMHGMCIRCCARKAERDDIDDAAVDTHVSLSYISEGLELREEELSRLRADEQRRVLASRKLFLILDLDHTLLNSARASEIDEASLAQLHAMTATETARPGGPELYDLRYMRMWTKLRPGARALLAGAAPLAEIMVYTMGDRAYAVEMARLLDPGGALLRRGRLISAPDSRTAGSKDLDIVLGSAPGVLILDDTPAVWKRHAANVIVADRYHFFPASSRGHGADPTRSCLARSTDEDEGDGVMAALLRVVREVHTAFFDGVAGDADAQQRDVRPILAALRAKVLTGCIIVFSHVFPMGEAAPERHALWRLASEMGAVCSAAARDDATHVVAGAAGTEKARAAAARGVAVVAPAWLHACAARWARLPEADYPVQPAAPKPSA